MASKVDLEYRFYVVIDKTAGKPGTIARNANNIAGEFFGEIKYELTVLVKGNGNNMSGECIARATIEAAP